MTRLARPMLAGGSRNAAAVARPVMRAMYENAQTTEDNFRNWQGVDYLSAISSNSFQVRRNLRSRSRYEVSNNPYLFGVCNGNADDLIDRGPTVQVTTPDKAFNREVERSWRDWCDEADLADKLRTIKLAKTVDGEGFLTLMTVEDMEHPVKLFPREVEADQVTTPAPKSLTELWVDGLELHPITGKPKFFHVLKGHPGDFFFPGMNPLSVERIPARYVIHWFQKFRPRQVRGVPVFTPSLDLFAELRSYRKSVLKAAEIAADHAAVLQTANGMASTDAEYKAGVRVRIARGLMTVLPPGMTMEQFDARQPLATYEMFTEKGLAEAFRPLAYPLNLALGTSQKFNFSSAKLDHVNYRNTLTVERDQCARVVLNALFRAWYEEAVLCGHLPMYDGLKVPPHEWHWPGFQSLDPQVDAQTDAVRLAGGTTTLKEFWATRGHDWRDVLAQLAEEMKVQQAFGLSFGDVVKRAVTETVQTDDANTEPANAA